MENIITVIAPKILRILEMSHYKVARDGSIQYSNPNENLVRNGEVEPWLHARKHSISNRVIHSNDAWR